MIKQHIAQSFGSASRTYDQQAPVQKWTAERLCAQVRELPLPERFEGLEIGCGTGFLTAKMFELYGDAVWTISDLSPEMLQTCRQRVGDVANFCVMDGEYPDIEKKFDLIVSSLAVQWFTDLEKGLCRLADRLKPKGTLLVSTLGHDSFMEWRAHLEKMGLPVGLHNYPATEVIDGYNIPDCHLTLTVERRLQPYDDGLSFLRALKAIGAHKPQSGYRALSSGTLRKAIRELSDQKNVSMTYDLFFIKIQRQE